MNGHGEISWAWAYMHVGILKDVRLCPFEFRFSKPNLKSESPDWSGVETFNHPAIDKDTDGSFVMALISSVKIS